MEKVINRLFIIFFIIIIIWNIFEISCYAVGQPTGRVSEFTGSFSLDGADPADTLIKSKDSLVKIVSTILNLVRIVGATIAFVILVVLACKYILASAGDKASLKKYATNYIIGAIVLFSASTIAAILKKFVIDSLTIN